MSDESEYSVGYETTPLIGGTATSLRPEIGQFSRGCTATLIAPNYVLTAGHCIGNGDVITDLTVRPGDAFMFTDRFGVFRNYPVTKLYAVGRYRLDYVPDHDLADDVLLLRLSSSVPLSQAVPAKLARNYPANGTPATIFGFGCQNRDTLAGGGFKQFVTFNYSAHGSNNLCPGDSGGPVVFGNPGDNGPIFAVNSGYWCFLVCHDDLGDAAWMANEVEAMIRELEGGFEIGIDRPGFDWQPFTATNAATCSAACSGTYAFLCKAYTWVPSGSSGTCFLKTALPDRYPHPSIAGIVSGVNTNKYRDVYERGIDRPGFDYNHYSSPSVNSCSADCAQDSRCRALTYAGGTCWLKNAVPSPIATSTSIISAVRGGFEMEQNRWGSDYSNFSSQFPENCQSGCARDSNCQAWTWVRPNSSNDGHCWLKNAVPGLSFCSDCISGIKGLEFLPGQ